MFIFKSSLFLFCNLVNIICFCNNIKFSLKLCLACTFYRLHEHLYVFQLSPFPLDYPWNVFSNFSSHFWCSFFGSWSNTYGNSLSVSKFTVKRSKSHKVFVLKKDFITILSLHVISWGHLTQNSSYSVITKFLRILVRGHIFDCTREWVSDDFSILCLTHKVQ